MFVVPTPHRAWTLPNSHSFSLHSPRLKNGREHENFADSLSCKAVIDEKIHFPCLKDEVKSSSENLNFSSSKELYSLAETLCRVADSEENALLRLKKCVSTEKSSEEEEENKQMTLQRYSVTELDYSTALSRLIKCEEKALMLEAENRGLKDYMLTLDANLLSLTQAITRLQTLIQAQQRVIQSYPFTQTSKKRSIQELETREERPEKKLKVSKDTINNTSKSSTTKETVSYIGIHDIRQRIPWKLNSGYVIHALLCCALNQIGAHINLDSKNVLTGITVKSYSLLKSCCLFLIHSVLCKKSKSNDTSSWDKSLRQHWFEGWSSRDEFVAVVKDLKKETLNELLEGHTLLSEPEKMYLISKVQSQQQS